MCSIVLLARNSTVGYVLSKLAETKNISSPVSRTEGTATRKPQQDECQCNYACALPRSIYAAAQRGTARDSASAARDRLVMRRMLPAASRCCALLLLHEMRRARVRACALPRSIYAAAQRARECSRNRRCVTRLSRVVTRLFRSWLMAQQALRARLLHCVVVCWWALLERNGINAITRVLGLRRQTVPPRAFRARELATMKNC